MIAIVFRPLAFALLLAGIASGHVRAQAPAGPQSPPAGSPGTGGLPEAVGFLHVDERLVFKLSWGIVSAGTTTIETRPPEAAGEPVRVRVLTESHGLVKALFPLENDSTCFIDPETGRPVKIEITGHDNKRETRSTTIFDYEAGEIRHTDEIRQRRSGTAALPDEPVYDIMVTMLKLRESPLQVGDRRRVKIAFEDDIYDLELTVTEEGRVKTPIGRFDAVAVEPEQKGELKGFFAKGGSMKFWISKGDQPQIVRMDFRVKIGTITGVLIEASSE